MTPEQRATFIANIPDAEQRRAAEEIWLRYHLAERKFVDACVAKDVGVRPVEGKTREQLGELFETKVANDAELSSLRDEANRSLDNWIACADYGEPLERSDGEIIRCALTGFLVHESDKYLIDLGTHECVLKAAIGVPLTDIVGEFISGDAPPLAIADDAMSIAEVAVNVG